MSDQQQREPRQPFKMGSAYHIIAGSLYLLMAFVAYFYAPDDWNEGMVHGVTAVAALYGLFRIGRGVMNILRK